MLQDRYGRLAIVAVFVVIAVILLAAPGMNSKDKSKNSSQLVEKAVNDTHADVDMSKYAKSEAVQEKLKREIEGIMAQANESVVSPEEKMLDAWGVRESSQEPAPAVQETPVNEPAVEVQTEIQNPQDVPVNPPQETSKKKYIKVNGKCFGQTSIPLPMEKAECERSGSKFGLKSCPANDTIKDGWAGAARDCGNVSKLPDMDDLLALARIIYASDNIKISKYDRSRYLAYDGFNSSQPACDTFEFRNVKYNAKIASEYGLPELSGYAIWGKNEISADYGLSLFFGEGFVKYSGCSHRNVQNVYAFCQVECD